MKALWVRLNEWLGFIDTGYHCHGCTTCLYPDGLGNAYKDGDFIDYAKLFGLVDDEPRYILHGKTHTEQVWF